METANRNKKLNQIVRLALQAGWFVRYGSLKIHRQNFLGVYRRSLASHTRFGQLILNQPLIIRDIIWEWFPNYHSGWSIHLKKYQSLNSLLWPLAGKFIWYIAFLVLLKSPFRKTAVSKLQLLIPYQFNMKTKSFFISAIKSIINN